MFEKDHRLITKIDLPGMKKDDVKVEITDGQLAISGERKSEAEEQGEAFHRCERDYGSFYRRVPLPARPDTKAHTIEIQEVKAARSAA